MIHVPNSLGDVVPLTHSSISTSLRDRLSYSVFPLGLITRNSMEVSREIEGRIITLQFFLPGVIMGLWESLDPPKSHYPIRIWNVTAGARFIFTLPKIQAAAFFTRLRKEFDLPNQIPKDISQQWNMFKRIANHPNFTHSWYNEIYFFPVEWIEPDSKSIDWIKFHYFLLQEAWSLSQYARNARNQDVVWDYFARILSDKGYKPNPLHIEILKHIIAIAMGAFQE
ncbi:MAG TPA: hypothetical protein VHE99_10340 [Gammaproteobacteria bacterium]|nr:hypothetical protein [Gammaproteobacteria bacterium]